MTAQACDRGAMLAAYDADPFRCWYALADWLDERDEPRAAARLRWWHGTARPALVADDVPRTAPDWHKTTAPLIDRVSHRCEWVARLTAVLTAETCQAKWPPDLTAARFDAGWDAGRFSATCAATLRVAERYAFGLATDDELSAAESAARYAAWSAAEAAAWSVIYGIWKRADQLTKSLPPECV